MDVNIRYSTCTVPKIICNYQYFIEAALLLAYCVNLMQFHEEIEKINFSLIHIKINHNKKKYK